MPRYGGWRLEHKYRDEIDGLRAIAVLPVMLFHAGFSLFSGGFVGVDVFFVISGYLITSNIVSAYDRGRFSLAEFYERRIRRIFPMLFVMAVCTAGLACWFLFPDQLRKFAQNLNAVAYLGSNFWLSRKAGYFDEGTGDYPLVHTWSLAVEEQFYFIFPLLCIAGLRLGHRRFFLLCMGLAAISLGIAEWGWRHNAGSNFYMLPGRAWELLAGSGVALYLLRRPLQPATLLRNLAALAGVVAIALAVFRYSEATPFPSLYALLPVAGTVAIIAFAGTGTWVRAVLASRGLVFIGLVSYSAYLWHQPILVFQRAYSLEEPSTVAVLLALLFTLLLSLASWYYIERPARNRHRFTRRQVYTAFLLGTAALFAIGFTLKANMRSLSRPNQVAAARVFSEYLYDRNPNYETCQAMDETELPPEKSCVYGNAAHVTVAMLGDSHANAIVFDLGQKLGTIGQGVRELTHGGCPPAEGLLRADVTNPHSCPDYNEQALSYLKAHPELQTIVMLARWPLYYEGSRFVSSEGWKEVGAPAPAYPVGIDPAKLSESERKQLAGEAFVKSVTTLLAMNRKVVLVYPVPEIGRSAPQYLAKEALHGIERKEPFSTAASGVAQRMAGVDKWLDQVPASNNLRRVKPFDLFCNTVLAGRCIAELDGKPLYFDDDHLDSVGADLLNRQVMQAIAQ